VGAAGRAWRNWYGNVECRPQRLERPDGEDAVVAAVAAARRDGLGVRVAGAGHSNVPLVVTDGVLLSLDRLSGIREVDAERRTVVLLAGTRIRDIGDRLWEHGLALSNQGDIDAQSIAGAAATGTHGTGVTLTNFGGALEGCRVVTADGEVLAVDPGRPDLLSAARTSVGALGVMTSLTLRVRDAYCLERRWETIGFAELEQRWRALVEAHRHCTFYWNPHAGSSALFGLPPAPADSVLVKTMDARPAGAEPSGSGRHSDPAPYRDRSYRVLADEYEPTFAELEYMIGVEGTAAALAEIRALMQRRHADEPFPVEVRFTAADDGLLSPGHERATCVVSCCGRMGTDHVPYLRDCDAVLAAFEPRPHWGKLAYMPPGRYAEVFPGLEAFRDIRRGLDPDGVFLNDHVRPILG